jgi:hypothetical protein
MDKAAIAGTYSNFRIVRSRKICVVEIELPIEQAQALITALGLPNPANETWVAVARLQAQTPAKQETPPAASVELPRPFPSLPYSQQAALRCQDLNFREFLRSEWETVKDEEDAADVVRRICGVTSRKDIKPGTKAEKLWLRLNTHYELWQSARAA